MKKHTKIYMDYFGYGIEDFVPCEICQNKCVDIHHIEARGRGGNPTGSKDRVENLIGVCRNCHEKYGDVPELKDKLKEIHFRFMELNK
jgi:HNH endonuclease